MEEIDQFIEVYPIPNRIANSMLCLSPRSREKAATQEMEKTTGRLPDQVIAEGISLAGRGSLRRRRKRSIGLVP
jgi:hypothetical protein